MMLLARHGLLPALLCAVLITPKAALGQESPFLYGVHDAEPFPGEFLTHLNSAGVSGWVTATVAIGHNPADTSGVDFRSIANAGHTVICRINDSYCSAGTIPAPADYAAFAQRCANFVSHSQGCTIWIIGNETNLASEWPIINGRKVYLTPQNYAGCFRLCYDAIKLVAPAHKVVTQALAPWAGPYGTGQACGYNHDAMPLNWVTYLNQMLTAIKNSTPGPHGTGPDGVALHITSRGYEYTDVHSTQKVNAGGQMLYLGFYLYKDWIELGIPQSMWNLPLYATECNGNYYWKGGHPEAPAKHYTAGWVQAIYGEINRYNTLDAPAAGKPVFHCVNLYRWCAYCDPWNIDGSDNPYKAQILSDLDSAAASRYTWNPATHASFTAAPTAGAAPLTVQFTDTSTGTATSRMWMFGDGYSSTTQNPTHVYRNPGSYDVALAVSAPNGSDTETSPAFISVGEAAPCKPYTVSDFEGFSSGSQVVFRSPRFSSTTSAHLAVSPDTAVVTDEVPGFDGTMCSKVQWAWVDGSVGRWLRLTTANAANLPNPTVDLRRALRLRLRVDSGSLRVCAGIRETGVNVPVGVNGGTAGTIEWIGASSVESGAPQGVIVSAQPGVWQTVWLSMDAAGVKAFTGDGVLSSANDKGVLEHLAFAPAGSAGPITVYIDALSQPCPPAGDFDHDADVDQSDFGHFQSCLSGAGIAQTDPTCQDARLDADADVDPDDYALFVKCFGGRGQAVPIACSD